MEGTEFISCIRFSIQLFMAEAFFTFEWKKDTIFHCVWQEAWQAMSFVQALRFFFLAILIAFNNSIQKTP